MIGLSTGLACVLLIALWVSDELSVDKFHKNDNRLYQVVELAKTDGTIRMNPVTSGLLGETLVQKFPEIEQETSVRAIPETPLKVDDENVKANGLYASKDFSKYFPFLSLVVVQMMYLWQITRLLYQNLLQEHCLSLSKM